jgi:hypothetical protein
MVRRLVQVPRDRAAKHARRSRQYITYLPPHSAHFVRPGKTYFGRVTVPAPLFDENLPLRDQIPLTVVVHDSQLEDGSGT